MVFQGRLSDLAIGLYSHDDVLKTHVQSSLSITHLSLPSEFDDNPIDVLLIDESIPDLFDFVAIVSTYPFPTILLADSQSNQIVDALNHGITDYITKPIIPELLTHRINQILSNQKAIHSRKNITAYDHDIVLNRLMDAVVATDPQFIITSWNKSAERLYGWRAEEVIGQQLQGLIPTFYVNTNREDVLHYLDHAESWHGELIQSNKYGEKVHVLVSTNCIRDDSGKALGYISITHDITDREAMATALQQSNESLELIYNHLPIMVISFSADGTILQVNDRVLDETQFRLIDLIHQPFNSLLTPTSAHVFHQQLEQATTSQNSFEQLALQVTCADDKVIDVILDVISVASEHDGNFYLGVVHNVTHQKAIEQSLANTETEYQTLISSTTDPIFVFDKDGTYLRIPNVKTHNYYMSPNKMVGRRLHDNFQEEVADHFLSAIHKAIDTQTAQYVEYDLSIQGRQTYFSASINPIAGRDEVVWVARDVTPIKIGEFALRETEQRYQQLFELANDMILIVDRESNQIIDANKQAQQQLGYTRQELLNLKLNAVEVSIQDTQSRIISQTLNTTGHVIFEQNYRNKDGTLIPVEISAQVIEYHSRKVRLSFARNITQRKQAMRAQAEEHFFTEALRDTIAKLARAFSMDNVLNVILESVASVMDDESLNIMIVDRDIAKVVRQKGFLDPRSQPEQIDIQSTFTLRHMQQTQQAIVITKTDQDARWSQFSDNNWSKSYVGSPIVLNGETIGYINLDSSLAGKFTNKHRQRLQAFADQAAIAIQNARLYEASQQYTEDLEERVAERTKKLTEANTELLNQIEKRQLAEDKLATERNILRTIINSLPVTVYVKNRQGEFTLANRFPYLRTQKQPIIGKTDLEIIPDQMLAKTRFDEEQMLMEIDETLSKEEYLITEAGGEHWIIHSKVPFHDEIGQVIGLVGVIQDITQIKLAERQLRQLLSSANCLLWSAVVDQVGDSYSWAIHIENEDSASDFLEFEIGSQGYTRAWLDSILPADQDHRKSTAHDHIRRNHPSYTLEYRCITRDGTEHWLNENVQIRQLNASRWHLVGVCLEITNIKQAQVALRESHDQLEQRVLERTARLSQANTELQQEILIRQQAEEAERRQRILAEALQGSITALNNTLDIDAVLDAVLDAMKLTVEHDATNIVLLEDDTLTIVRQRGYPSLLPITIPLDAIPDIPIVYHTQKPIIIADTRDYDMWEGDTGIHGEVHWVRSNIKIPIIYNGVVIGILMLDSAEPNKFTMEHANLLQTFANQASIAIQNARLFQAEHEQRILSETLRDSIKALNNTLDIEAVLDTVLDAIHLNIEHDAANIMLIDGDMLHIVRQRGYPDGIPNSIPIDNIQDMKNLQQSKQPFIIYDTHTYDGWMNIGDVRWIRSNIKIPIILDEQVIGILNLDSGEPYKYSMEQTETLQTFANQASIAIQNAQLYQQAQAEILERKRAEAAEREQRIFAETLRDTAITLNQKLNIEELLETIIRVVEEVVKVHDASSVIMMNPDKATGTVVKDRGFEDFGGSIQGLVLEISSSQTKNLLLEQRLPVFIEDTRESDLWIFVEDTAWIRSHISLPIFVEDEILALINLDSQHTHTFTQEHLERLVVFSHQVAIALKNAQLVEQIQGYTLELESRVQRRTAELENERVLLQLERSQLRAILDAMRDGVYYTDNNHNPIYINNALAEMTGHTSSDWLTGQAFEDVNQNSKDERQDLWRKIERHLGVHQFWHGETVLNRADGSQFDASLTRTEVKGIDDNRVGIVTVVRDISLDKQLEEQKARFIANAAHELRTPIANIKTRLFLMRHKPDKLMEHLLIAESATNWMQTLVDNLFDHSRFERGIIQLDWEELDLQDLIEIIIETQQPEAQRKSINVIADWDQSASNYNILADKSRLRQVITNLINNAIFYTPDHGTITIGLSQGIINEKQTTTIKVTDTGVGIEDIHLPHLFQPFYQATDDSKGAGLGLSIAREIVEAHQGTIQVESTVNEGTTFIIHLPEVDLP